MRALQLHNDHSIGCLHTSSSAGARCNPMVTGALAPPPAVGVDWSHHSLPAPTGSRSKALGIAAELVMPVLSSTEAEALLW